MRDLFWLSDEAWAALDHICRTTSRASPALMIDG
jgi:hypothetical protein